MIGKAEACRFGQIFRVPELIHITCNMGARDLPDMYALMPMLQLLHVICLFSKAPPQVLSV